MPRPNTTVLLVLDVDSTLIRQEVIELIAERSGTRDQVAEVTERAMRGELDFAQSLHERVATLAGVPSSVFADVLAEVTVTPGVPELIAGVHAAGGKVGVVSGGFSEVVQPLAASLGIDFARANELEVADGRLTGKVLGPVIDRAAKESALREWADELGLALAQTVAIGDGANDLDMIAAAGVGIAFMAKPAVREQADIALEGPSLEPVLDLIGLRR